MKLKILLSFLMVYAAVAGTEGNRVINVDMTQVKGPRSIVWQDCVGAGRVGEGLRDGWRRQLEACRRELGFKYLRMHGLLHDELGVYSEGAAGKVSDQDFFFKHHPAKNKGSVTVKLTNLPRGKYRLATYRIGYQQNDPYSRYLELGQPTDLSREAIADLKKLSSGAAVSETTLTVSGAFSTNLPMQENSVYMLSLTPLGKEAQRR